MAKRLCMENITGECRNPLKDSPQAQGMECPYCLRIDGKDGNGQKICEPEQAKKLFEIFKAKLMGED